MAFHFLEWLVGRTASEEAREGLLAREVSCEELFAAAADYTMRKLAWDVCIDLIANAIGRCEFRTFRGGAEVREKEYWTWNVSPNANQNSSVFLHKLIDTLYRKNEALVVSARQRDGTEVLAVADEWTQSEQQLVRENTYTGVTVENLRLNKTFRESDVLHFRLNQHPAQDLVRIMGESWSLMADTARRHWEWDNGQHWKVHVNQLASGADDFEANFASMISEQVKPFLEANSAVLPEFDGYAYERLGGNSASGTEAKDTRDLRAIAEDIFDLTARALLIPAVLVNGKVEATSDANQRFLTYVIDPLCDQIQEEANRKRYGYEAWARGDYLSVDSSSLLHYDLFSQAASVEKLIGSGVYSINDILRAAGQPPLAEAWAEEHYMTLNMARLGETARPLEGGST